MQNFLKVFVQYIRKSIGKSPHEKQDSNECNRDNGLASGNFPRTSDHLIIDALPPAVICNGI